MKNKKTDKRLRIRNSTAEFLIFTSQAGEDGIEVRVEDENVWLTQKLIAKLFGVEVNTINYHLKEIFSARELLPEATIRNFRIVQTEGSREVIRGIEHYNLQGIIAVGFQVNSEKATHSHPRNRELMRIFSDMDLCEQLGSGMKKILKAYSKDIFDISEHFISVRFPYNKEAVKILVEQTNNSVNGGVSGGVNGGVSGGVSEAKMQLSENALLVLNIIKHDGTLTQKQIAEQSKLSVRSVQRAIKELRDNKIIVREGLDKSGKYIFLSQ